jgi:flagellar hook protein FlgE
MSIQAIQRGVSGMKLGERKLAASAHNTANLLTEGFARVQVDGQEAEGGGVQAVTRIASPDSGPNLVADVIEQKSAAIVYRANLRTVQTATDMLGDLLNTRG